jgi:hypothetical protein
MACALQAHLEDDATPIHTRNDWSQRFVPIASAVAQLLLAHHASTMTSTLHISPIR